MFSEADVIAEVELGWRVVCDMRMEDAHGAESVVVDYYGSALRVWGV